MKTTTRAICAGLFAVLFLGIVSTTPAMAARTFSAGDVMNGSYEEGLLGATGTAGDPSTGQHKIPLTSSKRVSDPIQESARWSVPLFFTNVVEGFDHLVEWMRPFLWEHARFYLHR